MSQLNKILVLVLVVQALGFVLTRAVSTDSGPVPALAPFENLDVESVTKVVIEGRPKVEPNDPPQDKIELVNEGGAWGIADADGFPVPREKVDELLNKLVKIKSRNRVLNRSTYHEKLEVADAKYQRKVTVTAGDENIVVYFGSSPRFKSIHLRAAGADAVYLVNDFSLTDLGDRAWSWVSREYFSYPRNDVWEVKVENAKGEIALKRDPESNQWTVQKVKKPLDQQAVNDLIRKASNVNLEAPVGKVVDATYGLGDGATVVTLTTGTSTVVGLRPPSFETLTWRIGNKLEAENQYYVKADGNPYVVKVSGWSVAQLVDNTRNDLVQKEETK